MRRGRLAGPFFVVLTVSLLIGQAPALQAKPLNRALPEVKCPIYRTAWDKAIAARGSKGISADFLEKHSAFIASGCVGEHNVCPRSAEELDLANLMVILSMNAGMASTFAPFGCPKP